MHAHARPFGEDGGELLGRVGFIVAARKGEIVLGPAQVAEALQAVHEEIDGRRLGVVFLLPAVHFFGQLLDQARQFAPARDP